MTRSWSHTAANKGVTVATSGATPPTDKIVLSDLRANLDHSGESCEGRCCAMFGRATVLALVEVAEAARDVQEGWGRGSLTPARDRKQRLSAALRRFEFEDESYD